MPFHAYRPRLPHQLDFMNLDQYYNLYHYLDTDQFPSESTDQEQKQLRTQAKYFEIRHHLLYKKNRRNPDRPLRVIKWTEIEPVLYMMHKHPTAGHLGTDAMYHKISERYYWDQMYRDIQEYVKTCEECQRRQKGRRKEPLHPIQIGRAFERIGIDLVGPLPITKQNNRYIIVATEYLTRWPEARAVPDAGANTLAKFIFEEIVCRHGTPKVILSDQGRNFISETIRILCERFLIKHKFSSPYHPQTNGMVERFNRTLCESLAKVKGTDDWDIHIPAVLLAYRTKKHATTGYTPFQLVYGRQATLPIEALIPVEPTATQDVDLQDSILTRAYDLIEKLPALQENARKNTKKSQEKQKKYFDSRIHVEDFNIGDKVWIQRKDIEMSRSVKFEDKRTGPFIIHEKLGNGAYKLRTLQGKVLQKYYNSDRLAKYHEAQTWEPIVVVEDHEFLEEI
jgi:integrase-like protein